MSLGFCFYCIRRERNAQQKQQQKFVDVEYINTVNGTMWYSLLYILLNPRRECITHCIYPSFMCVCYVYVCVARYVARGIGLSQSAMCDVWDGVSSLSSYMSRDINRGASEGVGVTARRHRLNICLCEISTDSDLDCAARLRCATRESFRIIYRQDMCHTIHTFTHTHVLS